MLKRSSPYWTKRSVSWSLHGRQVCAFLRPLPHACCLCMRETRGRCLRLNSLRTALLSSSMQKPQILPAGSELVSRWSPTWIGIASDKGRSRKLQQTRMNKETRACLILSKVETRFWIYSQMNKTRCSAFLKPFNTFIVWVPFFQQRMVASHHATESPSISQKLFKYWK